jgi:4-amino-4-deoxy-L-arabinose transferase
LRAEQVVWVVLGIVLLATFLLKLRNLDHTGLTHWDEVFHAVVAQNVLKHPLKPTLIDVPYLPYQKTQWKSNHVWLHKPPLPFWQIALAFAVLGVDTFALRLPSVLLSTGAAWLTYLIGRELLDRRSALIAAILQAANPFLLALVQGYQFADHIDVALLFWVEVGIYFLVRAMRTGSWRDVLLAGVAQGLAFLSKSYLAGIIFGLALTAWLLPLCRLGRRDSCRIGPLHILGLLGATLLTVAPWVLWCLAYYPDEFWHEHTQVWKHLDYNVEGWAAPWDRLAFDYLIVIYGVFYGPILVAGLVLPGKALAERHTGLWLVYAWGLGVILPHLLATTKTPSATVIAVPALLLLLGCLISEAWRGEPWPLAALIGVLVMSFVFPAVIKGPGYSFPSPNVFGAIMWKALWVIYQVAGAMVIATVLTVIHLAVGGGQLPRLVQGIALVFVLCALGWLANLTVQSAWKVTNGERTGTGNWNVNDPASVEVGEFARSHLPDNAVLLCQERREDEHLAIMFYADRVCYSLGNRDLDQTARQILEKGGVPYVVSRQPLPLVSVYTSGTQGVKVYQLR